MTIFPANITANAETRYIEALKTTVTEFSVAENWRDRNGTQHTQYYKVDIWDKRGANLEKYLTKGRPVVITGRVSMGKPYLTKDGQPACRLEIHNPQIQFVTANQEAPAEVDAPVEAEEIPADDDKPF